MYINKAMYIFVVAHVHFYFTYVVYYLRFIKVTTYYLIRIKTTI